MKTELSYNPEQNGYAKVDVAMGYFRNTVSKDTARHALARWLRVTPGLWQRLMDVGYNPRRHHFTPLELKIVFDVLGEP